MSLFLATMIATVTTNVPLPGGDADAFACIPSAGYQWCPAKQKCYRPWEESCATTTTMVLPPGGDMDRFGCVASAGYQWCSAKQKCYRSWEESCASTSITGPTPTAPNCGGILNCVAYNDGCNSCNCVDRGTLCTTKFCVKPAPEMVSASPVLRRCTACTDGYVLNPTTNECQPSASCGGFAHCSGCVPPQPYASQPRTVAHCTSCVDGYVLNTDTESNECVRCLLSPWPCANPCGQFEGINIVNGQQWSRHCKGHPNTRCEGHADCVRGCHATYFDSVTGQEIVDCVLIWDAYYLYAHGITTM